ncbi:hypothetical protein B0H13DRAFT_1571635, partial [Mycena leptocephala]
PFTQKLTGKPVLVRSKWGLEYKSTKASWFRPLANTEQFSDDKSNDTLRKVFIR